MRRWSVLKPCENPVDWALPDLLEWRKQANAILANNPYVFWDGALDESFRSFEDWLARIEPVEMVLRP